MTLQDITGDLPFLVMELCGTEIILNLHNLPEPRHWDDLRNLITWVILGSRLHLAQVVCT